MNSLDRTEKFAKIISQSDKQILNNIARCKEIIKDCFGEHTKEFNILLLTLIEKLPYCLLSSNVDKLSSNDRSELVNRFSNSTGLSKESVDWAITTWALGLSLQQNELVLQLECGVKIQFVRVPEGEFLMGSDITRDKAAFRDEQPQHKVWLQEFYISKYPVTNAQYEQFLHYFYSLSPSGTKKPAITNNLPDLPVTNLPWNAANSFCQWLELKTGCKFGLPTEAEWEKAARGVDGRIYPWGNYWDNRKANSNEDGKFGPSIVGLYSPDGDSPFGCTDMVGNTLEWCSDWYSETYMIDRNTPTKDPQGPSMGSERVLRGGAWFLEPNANRCACRGRAKPDFENNIGGIRVVCFPNKPGKFINQTQPQYSFEKFGPQRNIAPDPKFVVSRISPEIQSLLLSLISPTRINNFNINEQSLHIADDNLILIHSWEIIPGNYAKISMYQEICSGNLFLDMFLSSELHRIGHVNGEFDTEILGNILFKITFLPLQLTYKDPNTDNYIYQSQWPRSLVRRNFKGNGLARQRDSQHLNQAIIGKSNKLYYAQGNKLIIELSATKQLELAKVQAGEFVMGSQVSDKKSIYLDNYWISKYTITKDEFEIFIKNTGYITTAEREGSGWINADIDNNIQVAGVSWKVPNGPEQRKYPRGDNHPVTMVSWNDAVAFTEWLSSYLSIEVKLPSEAEWEKAASGINGQLYPWGNDRPAQNKCNYDFSKCDTTPVGFYSPQGDSPYGCADMAGNVFELTRSNCNPYPMNDLYILRNNNNAAKRCVVKGGSYGCNWMYLRCSAQNDCQLDYRRNDIGFRIVAYLEE